MTNWWKGVVGVVCSVVYVSPAWAELRVGTSAPVGVDRLDQRTPANNARYSSTRQGTGAKVWVFDDECFIAHSEFGGRASNQDFTSGSGPQGSHGTQMASIAVGATTGVANRATVVCLDIYKFQGGFPPVPGFGLPELTSAVTYVLAQTRTGREVANMSFEFGADPLVDAQIQRLLDEGIPVVASAGNGTANVSTVSPARVPGVITVANLRANGPTGDEWVADSNFGALVDILAPGFSIPAAFNDNSIGSAGSGTSPAAAHVTGVVAQYLEDHPAATPAAVSAALIANATNATVSGVPLGTTNKVLFTDFNPPIYNNASVERLGATAGYTGNSTDGANAASRRFIAGDTEVTFFIGGHAKFESIMVCPIKGSPGFSTWRFSGYLARRSSAGASTWSILIPPAYDACGTPAGGAEVVSVATDPGGDVWALVKDTSWLGGATPTTRLMRFSGAAGTLVSSSFIGGSNVVPAAVTAKDALGNFYVVTTVTGADGYFPVPAWGNSGSDIGIVRMDSTGVPVASGKWRLGTSGNDASFCAASLGTSALVGGSTTGAFPFFSNAGLTDGFVIKVNSGGGLDFARQQGTSSDESVRGVATIGNFVAAVGTTNGALEATIFGSTGGGDGFLWLLDNNSGGKFWGALIGSTSLDVLKSVSTYELNAFSPSQFVLVGGYTQGGQFGSNPLGGQDAFLAKFQVAEPSFSTRELRWAYQSGVTGDETINAIALDEITTSASQAGQIQLVGTTSGTFPQGTSSPGGSDGFRVRITGF